MANYDAIIIGAGHNGLVTAAYLAKAGKKVLVLERRPIVGGIAVTEEIGPGFKLPTVAHLAGSFASEIVSELDLTRHGLQWIVADPLLTAFGREGQSLQLSRDPAKAQRAIAEHSKSDAENYPRFCTLARNLSSFLRELYGVPLPDKSQPGRFNPVHLLKIGWEFHRLGEKEMYEFLRTLPMSMSDLLDEWFDTDLLKAALAGTSCLASFVGPRQQGTAFNFLHHQLGASKGTLVRGGIGTLSQAIARAAEHFGATIETGTEVGQVLTRNGTATGVALQNGKEILAAAIISSADIKRTFLQLIEPTYLDPEFLLQVRNIRSRGTVAKINLALDALPVFKSVPQQALSSAIHIAPSIDYLERAVDDAKYGRFSRQPFLQITIPSVADPSLAPAGKHVMSVWMQSAPYHLRESNWTDQRETLGDLVVNLIEDYAPGFKNSIVHRQVLTPLDLEEIYGLTEGHPYHGEMSLDQIFFMRPIPGWACYGTPIENLFLCGSGTHPGGGITGLPGYYAAKRILQNRSRSEGQVSRGLEH